MSPTNHRNDDDYDIIFVRWITTRGGKRIYAWQYGKEAFPIRVRRKKK